METSYPSLKIGIEAFLFEGSVKKVLGTQKGKGGSTLHLVLSK